MFHHLTNSQLIAVVVTGMVLFHAYLGVTIWLIVHQVKKAEKKTMAVIRQGHDAYARAYSVLKGEVIL